MTDLPAEPLHSPKQPVRLGVSGSCTIFDVTVVLTCQEPVL
jgi:hypothetical protein